MENKVAVITGAAGGLGAALARELFGQGYDLALIDINAPKLEGFYRELTGNDSQRITIHCADISKEEQVSRARQEILQRHSAIDLLINNAGVSISQTFDRMSIPDFQRCMEVNFWGTVYCTKHFLPDLTDSNSRRNGSNGTGTGNSSRLVNIVSGFALMGFPGKTAYASSKAAIMSFTQTLKTELGTRGPGISLVIPPPLDTGIVRDGIHTDEQRRREEIDFMAKNGMPLEKAAKKILSAVKKGKYRIVIGTKTYWIDLFSRLFPTALVHIISRSHPPFA